MGVESVYNALLLGLDLGLHGVMWASSWVTQRRGYGHYVLINTSLGMKDTKTF